MSRYMITTDLEFALAAGYIGEVMVYPNELKQRIHIACTNTYYAPIALFYCGVPDEELRKRFNYVDKAPEKKTGRNSAASFRKRKRSKNDPYSS